MDAVVAGATGKPTHKKKRDLSDLFNILEARHLDEVVELLSREEEQLLSTRSGFYDDLD